jgi:hypothetical protein
LTPLDSSQIEVFLRIFWEFFIFWNLNLNFEWSVFLTLRGSGMATAAVEAGPTVGKFPKMAGMALLVARPWGRSCEEDKETV